MRLSSTQRKLALTLHVVATVGWLGSVAAFLGLSVIGLTSDDASTVRGAYVVMKPAAWLVLVPFAVATLISGLIVSLGSAWGLVGHYWVLFKLAIAVVATVVLAAYMKTFTAMAGIAGDPATEIASVRDFSPVLHSTLALAGLVAATVLSIYKPRGVTPFWRRSARG